MFDYIYASVLREEGIYYGETVIIQTVYDVDEQWHFGIEKGQIKEFLAQYEMQLIGHKDAEDLEREYFSNSNSTISSDRRLAAAPLWH